MVMGLFAGGLLAGWLFPQTGWGRRVCGWSDRIERRHILFLLVALIAMQAFALAMPADAALAMSWDVTVYLDLAIAFWTAAGVARLRHVLARPHRRPAASPLIPRRQSGRRGRRARATRRARPASDDDGRSRRAA